MTYRCVDCVFSEVIDKYSCDMICLKRREEVKCMQNCCEELILIPIMFVSHLIYAQDKEKNKRVNWNDSDKKAKALLKKYGFYGMEVSDEN